MNQRLFQVLVINLGFAIVYAIQKKLAWRIANWCEDEFLQISYDRERAYRSRPYPRPQKKNLYYRDTTD